jgi:hypothetical protein
MSFKIRPDSDGVVVLMQNGVPKKIIIKDWDLSYRQPLIPITNVPIIKIDFDVDLRLSYDEIHKKLVKH